MPVDTAPAPPVAVPVQAEPHSDPVAVPHQDTPLEYASPLRRIATIAAVVAPILGLGAAVALLWGWGVGWTELAILFAGYLLTGFGVTIGFHRLFTHKSFETGPVITATLGVLGSMAVQGPIVPWVENHRRHHQHSDRAGDLHSPHHNFGGGRNAAERAANWLRGVWHSHVGWMLLADPEGMSRYAPDLRTNKLVNTISRLFPLWILLGLLIPAAIGLAVGGAWKGALLGFLWGGAVRIFLVHHVTWSVNSVCHIWGSQSYRSHDESRNNPIFGVLAFGEGWHNNHHAFPASARHGLAWWEFDSSYLVIKAMEKLGLVWNVRVPDQQRKAAKRIG
jgi:stearoyl-CoA desaturase (delta-9 desaturase)